MEEEDVVDRESEPEILDTLSRHGTILDSRQSYLDDVLSKKLDEALNRPLPEMIFHEVAKIALEHDPIDLAHVMPKLPKEARVVVYDNLPDLSSKVIFMIHTSSNTRTTVFREIDDREIKDLIEGMPPDEAVSLLDDMSDRRMRRILILLDPIKRDRILELQKHDRLSAGRLMNDELFAFPIDTTISEAIAFIRNHPGIELARGVFALSSCGELIGYVPERNLLINSPHLTLRQVMRPIVHKVFVDTTRDEVVDLVERYKIPALPVVNDDNVLVGVITYEDVVEAMEDIADETIASIAGTAEDFSEFEPVYKRFFGRSPWLLVTIMAGLVSSTLMSYFSGPLWFAFVPFFVPLIAGFSGNVGLQCSTVIVRGISTGELSYGSRYLAISKEIKVGLLIGSMFGLMCALFIVLMTTFGIYRVEVTPFVIGATLGTGIFVACLTSTLLGSFSPFIFARLGVDPAVASGPIVTACNDVLSFQTFVLVTYLIHVFTTT